MNRPPRSISHTLLLKLLLFRRLFSPRQFVLSLSLCVGVCTAFAGLFLKWLIAQIQYILTHQFDTEESNWLYLVYPVVGIYFTMLFVRYVVRDDIGHGITKILYAIARKNSRIKGHNTWSSVFSSAITIGFGGSVGAEAPIVLTGSAIGSNLGKLFRLPNRTLLLLVGCGAAGAVAGIFKAPIAGLVFTVEVLMIDLTMSSLLPLLVSCVTATAITYFFSDTSTVFHFQLRDAFTIDRTPAYLLLGVFCGLVALYFTRVMTSLERFFSRFKSSYVRLLIGGSILSVLIYLFPSLYGEGYHLIELLLNGQGDDFLTMFNNSLFYGHSHLLLLYLGFLIIFKVFASTATNSGGGCGGIFAPSLFLGSVSGFFFCHVWNDAGFLGLELPLNNFALLGMCGLMSGVMHAPLTGIFLIAELTGGFQLFVPLMMVSVCAYLTIVIFERHSVYSQRLAMRGELLTHDKDHAILTLMSMDNVIEHYEPEQMLTREMTLANIVRRISTSTYNVFPVVDADKKLVGVLYVDDIRHLMFRTELFNEFRVTSLMKPYAARIDIDDSMDVVVKVFGRTQLWTLPVVDRDGHFIGFIRKSRVFTVYRQMMADFSND
ncbi:MAG: chloride channel protein [Bacteroidales bacterium]|nr:chloride channel protein [Candidatus Physcousia equi]